MLLALSPMAEHMNESLSSLRFASKVNSTVSGPGAAACEPQLMSATVHRHRSTGGRVKHSEGLTRSPCTCTLHALT